jgi:hypothetical protein
MINCQKKMFRCAHILFFSNSDRDFILKQQCTTSIHLHNKNIFKKVKKKPTIVYALHFALNIGHIFVQSLCYYLSFVFPANNSVITL